MTTRKEKFKADRKKMLAQTGREIEEVEVEEVKEAEIVMTVDDFDGSQERLDSFNQDLHDIFDEDGDRDAWVERRRVKKEKEAKEKKAEHDVRELYNVVCWIATFIILAFSAWSFHLFFSIMRWSDAHSALDYIVKVGGCIVFASMTAGMGFFFVSTIVFLLGIHYWGWLGNGMKPSSF